MWSLFSPKKPIEGQGKPHYKKPHFLPLPHPPRLLRHPLKTTTTVTTTKGRHLLSGAGPIESQRRRLLQQLHAPTYHAEVVAPLGRQWTSLRDIRPQGRTKQARWAHLYRAREFQIREQKFLSSTRLLQAVLAEQRKEFLFIPARSVQRRSQGPST